MRWASTGPHPTTQQVLPSSCPSSTLHSVPVGAAQRFGMCWCCVQGQADKLVLTGKLAAGASGTVFIGTWRNMRVAVKTVLFSSESPKGSTGSSTDSSIRPAGAGASFGREAQGLEMNQGDMSTAYDLAVREAALCSSMNHPNIVATYRCGGGQSWGCAVHVHLVLCACCLLLRVHFVFCGVCIVCRYQCLDVMAGHHMHLLVPATAHRTSFN